MCYVPERGDCCSGHQAVWCKTDNGTFDHFALGWRVREKSDLTVAEVRCYFSLQTLPLHPNLKLTLSSTDTTPKLNKRLGQNSPGQPAVLTCVCYVESL